MIWPRTWQQRNKSSVSRKLSHIGALRLKLLFFPYALFFCFLFQVVFDIFDSTFIVFKLALYTCIHSLEQIQIKTYQLWLLLIRKSGGVSSLLFSLRVQFLKLTSFSLTFNKTVDNNSHRTPVFVKHLQ